ncbi:MAG: IS110 family transposase [Chitinophagales bacterium]
MCKVIGIDISKQTFDVAFKKEERWIHLICKNEKKGFKELLKHLTKGSHIVMEASGPYYLQLATYLYTQSIKVSVVNPLVIRRYSQMKLLRAKTDKKDAQTIAQYGMDQKPKLWQPQDEAVIEIRQIHSVLEMIEKQKRQTKNQLEAFKSSGIICKEVQKELKQQISTLERREVRLEKRMNELAKQEYADTLTRLESIPGIGKKTAIMLTVITNNFKNFDTHKQLIAYVGFSPRKYESGTSVRGRGHICKMGKAQIRKLLYLCSWSAKKCNKNCIEMYNRLKEKGKPERVIKIALANKLLKQAFAIGKYQRIYNENFQLNTCF